MSTLMQVTLTTALRIRSTIPYLNDAFAVFICNFVLCIDYFCHDLAIMSLVLIAIDRFLAIKYPLHKYITVGRAKKLIAATWLLALIVILPFIYSYRSTNENNELKCYSVWDHFPFYFIYMSFQTLLFLFIPLCIMGILYSITVHKVWVRRIPGNPTPANKLLEHQTKINVLKMCITVVIVFAVCMIPLYTLRIIEVSETLKCKVPDRVTTGIVTLSFASYVLNPLIYFVFSQDFRNGLWKIIKF